MAPRSPKRRRLADKAGPVAPRVRLGVDERRKRLLDLGITIFSERPYDEVSVGDIAREAGVAKGLLYHYFPTKRGFYVAALRAASRQLLAETLERDRTAAPEKQAQQAVQNYLAFVAQRGPAYVALMRGGIGSDAEVARIIEKTRSTFVARVIEALPGGDPSPLVRIAVRGWVGFVEMMSIDWVRRRALPAETLAELARSVLFAAVRAAAELPAARPPVRCPPDRRGRG